MAFASPAYLPKPEPSDLQRTVLAAAAFVAALANQPADQSRG